MGYLLRGCGGQNILEKETLHEHISIDQIPVKALSIVNKINKKEEKQLPNYHLIFDIYYCYLLLSLMFSFLFLSFFSSIISSFIIWLWSSVSNIKDIIDMLSFAWFFNQNLEPWDTGFVIDMSQMFYYCNAFNQPLGSWDVSSVLKWMDCLEEHMVFIRISTTSIQWK